MQRTKKAISLLLNPFFCKIYLVVISFLGEIPIIPIDFTNLVMLGLFWGAAVFVSEIYRGSFRGGRYAFWLALVLLFYTVTVFLNYRSFFPENLSDLLYMFVLFMVVYPVKRTDDKADYVKELSILNYIIIGLALVAACVGLVMFILQFGTYVTKSGVSFPVGFVDKRLNGIYKNAIYPTAGIGLICCAVQLAVNRLYGLGRKWYLNLLLAAAAVLNFLFICLMNSKGNFFSLYTAAFVLVGLAVYRLVSRHWQKIKKYVLKVSAACLAGGAAALVLFTAVTVTRQWIAYVPPIVAKEETPGDVTLPPPIDIDRDEIPEEYGLFTGRVNIWAVGLQRFTQKPVFGYGAFAESISIPGVEERWCHYHNVYINSLVSLGAAGCIPLMTFFALSVLSVLKYLFGKTEDRYYSVVLAVFTLLTFLFMINLADTTVLFMKKQSSFVFWLYLGYAAALAGTAPSRSDAALKGLLKRITAPFKNNAEKPSRKESAAL